MSAGGGTTSWQQLPMAYSSWLELFVLLLGPVVERYPIRDGGGLLRASSSPLVL